MSRALTHDRYGNPVDEVVVRIPFVTRFACPNCGPTNRFMSVEYEEMPTPEYPTGRFEMKFCIPCHPNWAQGARNPSPSAA